MRSGDSYPCASSKVGRSNLNLAEGANVRVLPYALARRFCGDTKRIGARVAGRVFARWISLLTLSVCAAQAMAAEGRSTTVADRPLNVPITVEVVPRLVTPADILGLREIGGALGSGLSISPDGTHVAFELHQADTIDNSYRVAWFIAATSGDSAPINVGDGGDASLFKNTLADGQVVGAWVSLYAKWSPNGRGIAYKKKVDGEIQVWWSSLDGSEVEQLTDNAADVRSFRWSQSGSRIFFETDVDRAELHERAISRFRDGHVFDYQKPWSALDGAPVYPPYSLLDGKPILWVLDVASRTERLATSEDRAEYEKLQSHAESTKQSSIARHTVRSPALSSVAWLQPDDPLKQGAAPPMTLYASTHVDSSNTIRCAVDECTGAFDIRRPLRDGLLWRTAADEVLFARKEGVGYSRRTLYAWQVRSNSVRKILATDEWISDCALATDQLVCFRETPTSPRTVVSVDLLDGSMETLFDPNPEFERLVIGGVELFEWESEHGQENYGYLVKPPGFVPGGEYPMVIVGYRARKALRGGVGNEYPVHVLAANGFVVLVYDKPEAYRAFETLSDPIKIATAMWGDDLFDVRTPLESFRTAINSLAHHNHVDPDRVAITGLSAGVGDLNYALINSDIFATAIASSSDFAPSTYYLTGGSAGGLGEYRRAIGAGRWGTPDGSLWERMSLSRNAQQVDAPLLVNVSDSEHVWALEEVIGLLEHGKPVEMVVYEDEGHIKWHPAHRQAVYERNVDWLNFWLQDIEDTDPAKEEQYARWRVLRNMKESTESAGSLR